MPGGDRLVLGTDGNLRLSLEVAEFFADHRCRMLPQPTPQAIRIDNQTKTCTTGLLQMACRVLRVLKIAVNFGLDSIRRPMDRAEPLIQRLDPRICPGQVVCARIPPPAGVTSR